MKLDFISKNLFKLKDEICSHIKQKSKKRAAASGFYMGAGPAFFWNSVSPADFFKK